MNRILNSAASEIWRHKDESGSSAQDIDKEIAEARVTPMGPFFLSDLLGLDTVLHVAEHLQESYGDRFYVSPEMQSLVAAGNFGQKTGKGFYDHGKNGSYDMEQATATETSSVVERFTLKAFVEACLVLEEGVSSLREIETGMMTGAGILPGPFARADERGLDEVLAALERAEAEWGDRFAVPMILRRLVAQGRLGKKTGQGFFPYPQPDADFDQKETVLLETRGEIAIIWLNRPPANPLSPQVITRVR